MPELGQTGLRFGILAPDYVDSDPRSVKIREFQPKSKIQDFKCFSEGFRKDSERVHIAIFGDPGGPRKSPEIYAHVGDFEVRGKSRGGFKVRGGVLKSAWEFGASRLSNRFFGFGAILSEILVGIFDFLYWIALVLVFWGGF